MKILVINVWVWDPTEIVSRLGPMSKSDQLDATAIDVLAGGLACDIYNVHFQINSL